VLLLHFLIRLLAVHVAFYLQLSRARPGSVVVEVEPARGVNSCRALALLMEKHKQLAAHDCNSTERPRLLAASCRLAWVFSWLAVFLDDGMNRSFRLVAAVSRPAGCMHHEVMVNCFQNCQFIYREQKSQRGVKKLRCTK
jgi:hypothetical protein